MSDAPRLMPVDEHLRLLLEACATVPRRTSEVPVAEAHGCVLAQDVRSAVDVPAFTNSAMDGYAVRAAELVGAGDRPVVLPVAGDIPAGRTDRVTLVPGTTMRIMTGAALPDGADAVVPVELTDGGTERVTLRQQPQVGAHVRPAGDDLSRGELALAAGTFVDARVLALLVSLGHPLVEVVVPPRVVVLSTGDELVEPGGTAGHGTVVDSNGPMLVAVLREHGFTAERVRAVADDEQGFRARLDEVLLTHDAVITTGGVSAGAYDTVKAVLARDGEVAFRGVAMQPGKPQGFGLVRAGDGRHVPVFTLPGNPVSSMVSYQVFAAPALRLLAGRPAEGLAGIEAVADDGWRTSAGRTQLARVRLRTEADGPHATLAGGQGSHVLGALAHADALAVVPAEVDEVVPGMRLTCLLLRPLPGKESLA
ncbi:MULTISPECIES: gephyrin-like molybdotransferase Glp [Arsenicicoccus]|uniref:molybdopterin molybdotransferase MoeA n=1 Tax=Arsenicicoccus TaxID=267408 RepID=UPI00257AC60B|nr:MULTISPECIES: gephyrin-like molybdotransferase Glp [Arsenicicoccus]